MTGGGGSCGRGGREVVPSCIPLSFGRLQGHLLITSCSYMWRCRLNSGAVAASALLPLSALLLGAAALGLADGGGRGLGAGGAPAPPPGPLPPSPEVLEALMF